MLNESATRFFANTAPFEGEIHVQALAAATSASIDLSSIAPSTGAVVSSGVSAGGSDISANGEYFEIMCDQPIWLKLAAAAGTADETATSGANRVYGPYPANQPIKLNPLRPNGPIQKFLVCKTTLASTIRIRRASYRLS
jgi:hypothetical protein